MPFIRSQNPLIEVEVSDLIIDGTVIKQKVRYKQLVDEQAPTGRGRTTVLVMLMRYSAAGNAYGRKLEGPGFSEAEVPLGTDSNTLIDVNTGAILAMKGKEETALEWDAKCNSYGDLPVMLQDEYFIYLRDHVAVKIGDLVRLNIAQADQMGRFGLV